VNNLVIEFQNATHMRTQHYQIVERFIESSETGFMVAYDGSGYTAQAQWVKVGELWLIYTLKFVADGHGHLGLPPSDVRHDAFVAGLNTYTGGRRLEAMHKEFVVSAASVRSAEPRRARHLQSAPLWGNLNPLISRLPAGLSSDASSVQLLWDRFALIERISMYSWLRTSSA
jgi:hypothetical protein